MSFADRLARGRAGDRGALDELFSPWRPLLKLQAGQLLGAELAARVDPSDVVQEALTQAYASLAQFRGQTEAEWVGWLRTIVAGQAANTQRFHQAAKRDTGRDDPLPVTDQGGPALAPLGQAILREEDARLAAAIQALPANMRDVVVRRVFHQQPFEAVARALGCSPGAARVLWTRSLRRLRELLGPAT
jgi:RNA polymerase sigma-70 factor (ECF subfamily)